MKPTHYETLGVPPDADAPTLKRAYRKKARQSHPDTGGDTAAFQRIQRAYSVLKDPLKRAEYDRYGEASEVRTMEQQAQSDLCGLLVQAALATDGKRTNILNEVRNILDGAAMQIAKAMRQSKSEAEKLRDSAGRLKAKNGGEIVFVAALLAQAGGADERTKAMRFNLDKNEEIRRLVNGLEYRVDVPETARGFPSEGSRTAMWSELMEQIHVTGIK